METVGTISYLIRYPVKSMLGETLPGAAVTQRGLDGFGRRHEHPIADIVAACVIDTLEVIEVEEQDGETAELTVGPRTSCGQRVQTSAAVAHAGHAGRADRSGRAG